MASFSWKAGARLLSLSSLWLVLPPSSAMTTHQTPGIKSNPSKDLLRPNFVFIITDDQDQRLGSLDHMPLLRQYLRDQGTTFQNHYCTVALCCPSRVSLLTGKAAHNTNVTDVSYPYGGYAQFINNGLNSKYLPVWLQESGYDTYYTGKLMNGFGTSSYLDPPAQGWNESDFLLDPLTYYYYNATMGRNREPYRYLDGKYSTDVVADDALEYIEKAALQDNPFFLGVAPVGPHAQMSPQGGGIFELPVPAERHEDIFPHLKAPKGPSFNKLRENGAAYYATLPELTAPEIAYMDTFYQRRIEALQSIDELVESIVQKLDKHNLLDSTYIIYTSDNGYHMGQHRLPPGKTCNIEEDINVPFIVRGPGVRKNAVYEHPTTHTDIVPTLFSLADIPLHADFDGDPIPVTEDMQMRRSAAKTEHVNVEFWGSNLQEGAISEWAGDYFTNNTYKHVRVLSSSYDLSYTVWCTNQHELYDLTTDPFQSINLYHDYSPHPTSFGNATATTTASSSAHTSFPRNSIAGYDPQHLQARLDALLLTLKGCKGSVCVRPWEKLHPRGDVHSLADAMDRRFDRFYEAEQQKVSFDACMAGYLKEFEGPLEPVVFQAQEGDLRDAVKRWETWT